MNIRLLMAFDPPAATARFRCALGALSSITETKIAENGGHAERVARISVVLATRLGYEGADLEAIETGALLHDVGKIGIPDAILQKPGALDEEEWRIMRKHPVIGVSFLSPLDLAPIARQIVRSTHERIDGSGYPDGLTGAAVPPAARIAAVADALDALITDRPYRPGRSTPDALAELRRHAGTQFCPTVVAALEQAYQEDPCLLAPAPLAAGEVA